MMLDTIRRHLEQYEGQWMLPDDLDALLEIIGRAIAEGPECGPGKSRTHWRECWRYASHHACTVAEVERLRAALVEIQKMDVKIIPRRPFYDNMPDGLVESDKDFVNNNFDACIAFLEQQAAARGALRGDEKSSQ